MPAFLFGQSSNVGPFAALRELQGKAGQNISPSDKPVGQDVPPAGGLGTFAGSATAAAAAAAAASSAAQDQGRATLEQLDRNKPRMQDTDP